MADIKQPCKEKAKSCLPLFYAQPYSQEGKVKNNLAVKFIVILYNIIIIYVKQYVINNNFFC